MNISRSYQPRKTEQFMRCGAGYNTLGRNSGRIEAMFLTGMVGRYVSSGHVRHMYGFSCLRCVFASPTELMSMRKNLLKGPRYL